MAAATSWMQEQVTEAFRRMPELESLLLKDVQDTRENLGEGAFGFVRKLRVGATFCAGKTVHEALTNNSDKGAKDVVFNFLKECKMLANLRHPNIVQFMGVCLLGGSNIPILVMELLTDSLHNFILTHINVALGVKQSLLADVASALVYLHSREPQIIHRDLTAKNVLLDERSMRAKVGDLGNSRFKPKSAAHLTYQPGTPLYMPPEAFEPNPDYCDKLDIFSFGHLSLFVLSQVFPDEILAPNYNNSEDGKLISRTEVERRERYIDILRSSKELHPLVTLMKMCLDNLPNKRPSAMQILQRFEELNPDYYDVLPFQHRHAMVEMLNKKDKEIKNLQRELQQRETELELFGESEVMSGPLEKFCPKNIMRKWKSYTFKLTDTHLRFYNSWIKKPRDEIPLSAVSSVYIPHPGGRLQGEKHCFEVQFNRSDSPWILSAYTVEERKKWMAAIRMCKKPKMKANAAYGMIPLTAGMGTPDAIAPLTAGMGNPDEIAPLTAGMSNPDAIAPLTAGMGNPDAIAETNEEHDYERISPLLHLNPPRSPLPEKKPEVPHRPEDLKRRVAPGQSDPATRKEKGSKPPVEAPSQQATSSTYEKIFASLNRRMNKFTPTQISHLVAMLQQTQDVVGSAEGEEEKKEVEGKEPKEVVRSRVGEYRRKEERIKKPHIRIEDKDSDQPSASTNVLPYYVNYSSLLRPNSSENLHEKQPTIPRTGTKSPYYVNYLELCERGRPGSVKNHRGSERRPRSASPTPHDSPYFTFSELGSGLSAENSQSHLDLSKQDDRGKDSRRPFPSPKPSNQAPYLEPATQGRQRDTLKHMLRQSRQSPESLLITEDDTPEEYIARPQWAKANTRRPGPNTLASMHRRKLYIRPQFLSRVESLGEGRFGRVYQAELLRKFGANITVVVKSIDCITPEFEKEVATMLEVVHPNIVCLYGLIDEGEMRPAIVTEYMSNGDLKTFLTRNPRDKLQLMKYMVDVAMGMHYLSERGIIHRNLAARNVLVDADELCKVSDFGLVREVPSERMLYASRSRGPSPIRWMAPESISKRVFSPASDIWSFGVLQWEMFNPKKLYPYPALGNEEVVDKVTRGYPMATPRKAPQSVVKIMKACWNSEPSRRPSFLLIANLLTGHIDW